jgi:hypothetical protein
MNDAELKSENAALRKQNKNLKALLEEALEIISKLKEFVDQQPDESPGTPRKPRKTTKKAAKKAVKKAAKKTAKRRKAS